MYFSGKTLQNITQQNHVMRGMISDILSEMHTIKILIQRPLVEIMSSNFFQKLGITFPIENDEDF